MSIDPRAGQQAAPTDLVDLPALVTAYYSLHPDPAEIGQRVSFGTSGHRGSSLDIAFNDDHIAATTRRSATIAPASASADRSTSPRTPMP